ncbi:NIPSNAP family protein [Phyllobacterium sp. A18/5-2]|uniref:NIPSNAP family protein n=1 Tax=Phyllobacterium sp. A18/5-2 TaxID=2978392 RepID=UPI0021C783B1|nr:NIPSNAP family protein [Phyllobacterium sp. A18/5-2]UXN65439.1 NIPSNAP family protein [Phyllobacterium sp. A18/5-2]
MMHVTAPQTGIAPASETRRYSPIAELRRYTLHPGRRDGLIAVFDAYFLEGQESCGMKIIGQFRDMDDPDAFVWLRGFDDMHTRRAALTAFYDGPVWGVHRNTANATMIDSDDVLLLHPAEYADGFMLPAERPGRNANHQSPAIFQAVTYKLALPAEAGFLAFYGETLWPVLQAAGEDRIGLFASEHGENTFPRLPVRLGENVVVVFSRFDNAAAHADFTSALAGNSAWLSAQKQLEHYLIAPPVIARLAPTARSLMR